MTKIRKTESTRKKMLKIEAESNTVGKRKAAGLSNVWLLRPVPGFCHSPLPPRQSFLAPGREPSADCP